MYIYIFVIYFKEILLKYGVIYLLLKLSSNGKSRRNREQTKKILPRKFRSKRKMKRARRRNKCDIFFLS